MMDRPVNPSMLVLARDSRELTQSKLAKLMTASASGAHPVTQGYISKAEAGTVVVTGDRLALFAEVLGYPEELLLLPGDVYGFGTACIHHRKRQSLSAPAVRQVHAYLNLARIQMRRLVAGTDVQPANAYFRFPLSPVDTARDAAAEVRKRWNIPDGPVGSVVELLESAGGMVVLRETPSRAWDAVSQWPEGEAPVFLLNAATPTDRQRFTLAHELGHMICHPHPVPDQEQQANEFAAEFLMPASQILEEMTSGLNIEQLGQLKQRWKVSMAALVRRAHNLAVISDWRYRSLNVELSSLGYRTDEPGALNPEAPCLPNRAFRSWITQQGAGVDDLAARTLLTAAEFHDVFPFAGLDVQSAETTATTRG